MKVAIQGCCHGELDVVYEVLKMAEERSGVKIDLLICCGDFQAVRDNGDLNCMAAPQKYRHMQTFYKYYSGEKTAPIMTLFIGGNHEASNHLWELGFGGWVAPNMYYLGNAGVVKYGGLRIAGISGIYNDTHYRLNRFESPPYNARTMRSTYHTRLCDVFKLKQLSGHFDVMLSHDWPLGIYYHGELSLFLRLKPFFTKEVHSNTLGNPAAMELLKLHKPSYWFSGHLHVKFSALYNHTLNKPPQAPDPAHKGDPAHKDKPLPPVALFPTLGGQAAGEQEKLPATGSELSGSGGVGEAEGEKLPELSGSGGVSEAEGEKLSGSGGVGEAVGEKLPELSGSGGVGEVEGETLPTQKSSSEEQTVAVGEEIGMEGVQQAPPVEEEGGMEDVQQKTPVVGEEEGKMEDQAPPVGEEGKMEDQAPPVGEEGKMEGVQQTVLKEEVMPVREEEGREGMEGVKQIGSGPGDAVPADDGVGKEPGTPVYTKFLALDKPLPRKRFLQILDMTPGEEVEVVTPYRLEYDSEWLAILKSTESLMHYTDGPWYLPSKMTDNRLDFTPTEEELVDVEQRFSVEGFGKRLVIPENFSQTVPPYVEGGRIDYNIAPKIQEGPQTAEFCEKLGITNPFKPTESVADIPPTDITPADVANPDEIDLSEEASSPADKTPAAPDGFKGSLGTGLLEWEVDSHQKPTNGRQALNLPPPSLAVPLETSHDTAVESGDATVESGDTTVESHDATVESGDTTVESGDTTVESCDPAVESCDPAVESCDPAVESCDPAVESQDEQMESCDTEEGVEAKTGVKRALSLSPHTGGEGSRDVGVASGDKAGGNQIKRRNVAMYSEDTEEPEDA